VLESTAGGDELNAYANTLEYMKILESSRASAANLNIQVSNGFPVLRVLPLPHTSVQHQQLNTYSAPIARLLKLACSTLQNGEQLKNRNSE
jgi:hypothetical protein